MHIKICKKIRKFNWEDWAIIFMCSGGACFVSFGLGHCVGFFSQKIFYIAEFAAFAMLSIMGFCSVVGDFKGQEHTILWISRPLNWPL